MRAKSVLQYLRDNPRFLRRHQSELTRMLRLAERDIVDLTGRQIATLRDENTDMRQQLHDWYQNAADNEGTLVFLHRFALRLAASNHKRGYTARQLALESSRSLGVKLSKIVDLEHDDVELSPLDRRRLDNCPGALRTEKPLKSFGQDLAKGKWSVYLNIPVHQGRKIRAVIVFGSKDAKQFPRAAHADYAVQLAEMVGVALAQEK